MVTEFVYEDMTPALRAYLDRADQHPGYKYATGLDGKRSYHPTPESEAAVNAWRAEAAELRAALSEGELDRYVYAQKVWYCRPETQKGVPVEHVSPSGEYRLVVTQHVTRSGCWTYTKGCVYKGDTLLTTVYRNYSAFPYAWVEDHPRGVFLLCGEDYQGQTLINLHTGSKTNVTSEGAESGWGFCWASIHPSPSGNRVAVRGCYWGAPYETLMLDFTAPESMVWPVLARSDVGFGGWSPEGAAELAWEWEEVNIPGHPLHGKKENACTIKDWDVLEKYIAEHDLPPGSEGEEPGWVRKRETCLWDV